MLNPKVSVIIPVYNVENYLKRCLDSIDAQTYDNYEVILVDDGSTDGSGTMCDRYKKEKPNVTVVHQRNQGLSAARNTGIEKATGEYITFVDSDDYVSDDYIDYLMRLIIDNAADISATELRPFYDSIPQVNGNKEKVGVLDREGALCAICYGKPFGVSACAKMFKREVCKKYLFPEGKHYEDLLTIYKYIAIANRIAYSKKEIYYYFQRPGSIMHKSVDIEHVNQGLDAAKELFDFYKKNYPSIVKAARFRFVYKIIEYIPQIVSGKDSDKKVFSSVRQQLIPHFGKVMMDKDAYMSTKLKMISVLLGYHMASYMVFLCERYRIQLLR